MKANEIRNLSDAELAKKLADLKAELFNLRFSHVTGSLSNPLLLAACKKQIAIVKTVIRERELGISKAPVASTKSKTEAKKAVKNAEKAVKAKPVKKEKAEKIMV